MDSPRRWLTRLILGISMLGFCGCHSPVAEPTLPAGKYLLIKKSKKTSDTEDVATSTVVNQQAESDSQETELEAGLVNR